MTKGCLHRPDISECTVASCVELTDLRERVVAAETVRAALCKSLGLAPDRGWLDVAVEMDRRLAAAPERFATDLERAAGHLERLGEVAAGEKVVVTVRAPEGARQLAARLRIYARGAPPAAPASPPEAGR